MSSYGLSERQELRYHRAWSGLANGKAMAFPQENSRASSKANRLINLLLLLIILPLGFLTFFSLQELIWTIGAAVILPGGEGSVRSHYALVTIRNIWLLFGGVALLAFVIGSTDYFFKHSRELRARRLFLRLLALELALIGLSGLVTA